MIEGTLYLQGTQVVEKGFNQTKVGALRLQFYSAQLVVGVDGQHAITAKSTTQLKRPNDDRRQTATATHSRSDVILRG